MDIRTAMRQDNKGISRLLHDAFSRGSWNRQIFSGVWYLTKKQPKISSEMISIVLSQK